MKTPMMKTPALATIYLDNERVGLMGDPMPLVAKIVAAGGKSPESVQVRRGQSPDDTRGKPLRLDETIDRTSEPTKPIYLTCLPKAANPQVANPVGRDAVGAGKVPPQYVAFPNDSETPRQPRGPLPPQPGDQPKDPVEMPHRQPPSADGEAEWDP